MTCAKCGRRVRIKRYRHVGARPAGRHMTKCAEPDRVCWLFVSPFYPLWDVTVAEIREAA